MSKIQVLNHSYNCSTGNHYIDVKCTFAITNIEFRKTFDKVIKKNNLKEPLMSIELPKLNQEVFEILTRKYIKKWTRETTKQ